MKTMTKGKHILVVEDEGHLAAGIKYNLDAEGYHVTTVGDGPSALRLIKDGPDCVDLVILDLMLPGMSGYAVCESLRADEHHMPILILSARTLSEDRARGFDVGADQYLTKPFDLDELLSRVKGLLTLHSRRAGRESVRLRRRKHGNLRHADAGFFGLALYGLYQPALALRARFGNDLSLGRPLGDGFRH